MVNLRSAFDICALRSYKNGNKYSEFSACLADNSRHALRTREEKTLNVRRWSGRFQTILPLVASVQSPFISEKENVLYWGTLLYKYCGRLLFSYMSNSVKKFYILGT